MARSESGQTAVVQSKASPKESGLPLIVAHSKRLPALTDPLPCNTAGCDFCGVVQEAGPQSLYPVGARVAGADFPYRPNTPTMALLQSCRHRRYRLGHRRSGHLGPGRLESPGIAVKPAEKRLPVLVYGGATATGIMAIQMLKLSGYAPIAVCSENSAPLVMGFGCVGTASYTSPTYTQEIKQLAGGLHIKYALDCITDAESAAICFASLSRTGGRYACLEAIPDAWITRRAVAVKVVMGFEGQNYDVDLGHPVYSRKANPALHAVAARLARELQPFLDDERITTQPIREIEGRFEGVITALEMFAEWEGQR
ncbi:hypothetical protein DL770_006617 [Monosporascus sp. CRB-9-2]|nr:hypothetical protein DL770_006617 [Monosporascus sp. CRB-9-2]